MSELMDKLNTLSSAEEFLAYLDVPYDQAVVHVNRLHILKRFHQYLRNTPGVDTQDEAQQRETCRELLTRAYEDFVRSTPAQEKVFKVFQDMDGQQVTVDSLRSTLPSSRDSA
jgi:nitrogenase-stabilizing/protective protein